MKMTYDISIFPLLYTPILIFMLALFAMYLYNKTRLKTELYISVSMFVLVAASLYVFTLQGENIKFDTFPFQIVTSILLVVTIIMQLFSEKRDWQSCIPIAIVLILTIVTLVFHPIVRGVVFPLLLFGLVGWRYLRIAKRDTTEIVRMSLLSSLGITVILGSLIGSAAFQFLSSLLIASYLVLENTHYFNRVIALFRNVSITSMTDSLTQLYNKSFFVKKAEQLFGKQPISIIFVDIDNFKQLNDQKGHDYGDEVLQKAGMLFKGTIEGNGYPCRFGGEELVGIITTNRAMELAERFRKNLEKTTGITVSVGVAHSKELDVNEGEGGINELIKLADERMYQAKLQGKNRVC
ncbi:GGDEF domain-containing protein [Lysinibacillus xylanilyticus]|uniref:GGDEF domain-containing protein n=1 Tax=Lysinibacillus xylanilyticus TaxID=582475 RepID=UPI0038027C3A